MVRFFLLAAIVLQLLVISSQRGVDEHNICYRLGFNSTGKINDQISKEFKAMYMYDAMTSYFGRPSVALPGFKKFFRKAADENRQLAHKLIDYLNKRGGHVRLKTIFAHPKFEWEAPIDAVKTALEAEKNITTALYNMRHHADKESDPLLVNFIESEFLSKRVNGISYLRELIAKLTRVRSGLGEYMIDKELL